MDRFLVFVAICGLGGAYAGIVRRNVPSTQQQVDGMQGLTGLATQLIAGLASMSSQNQPGQTGTGSQVNAGVSNNGIIESGFRGFFANNGQTMNYDLSEAMQMMNQSYGIPAGPSKNTSQMTRDEFLKYVQEQSKIFNNILNSEIVMMLEPERVVRFLNISKQASDPAITNDPVALAALQTEYQTLIYDFQNKFQEKVNQDKSSKPANSGQSSTLSLPNLQQQISAISSMYNRELSQAMKPVDIAGALSGSDQGMNGMSQNLGTAMMNIFNIINQGSNSSNKPLQWDVTKQ